MTDHFLLRPKRPLRRKLKERRKSALRRKDDQLLDDERSMEELLGLETQIASEVDNHLVTEANTAAVFDLIKDLQAEIKVRTGEPEKT